MITEGIGGICPKCGYDKMFQRYGSFGWFQFDACPKCYFAYGVANGDEEYTQGQVWDAILDAYGEELKRLGHTLDIDGLYVWAESMERYDDSPDTVFNYTGEGCRI